MKTYYILLFIFTMYMYLYVTYVYSIYYDETEINSSILPNTQSTMTDKTHRIKQQNTVNPCYNDSICSKGLCH